jgi:uncharacterized membrane protein
MEIEVSTVIDRPVATVWDFYAVNHVQNHPRWDSTIELEATSDDPVGVGTVIKRRANRGGTITEGTMEVTEFETDRSIRVRTQDGPMTIHGWAVFEEAPGNATRLSMGGDFSHLDPSMEELIRQLMQRSLGNIKSLIESET